MEFTGDFHSSPAACGRIGTEEMKQKKSVAINFNFPRLTQQPGKYVLGNVAIISESTLLLQK